ncbi:hypothetical protein M432DRAFT_641384 [Thermoascus aurantiacus ATCC 26904]
MAGSGARVKVPADRLDVLPSFSRAGDACCRRSDGTLVEERRRRCEPVEGSEEVEGSSVVKEREEKRTQKRSEKSRQTRRNDRLGRDEPLRRNAQLLRFRVALLTAIQVVYAPESREMSHVPGAVRDPTVEGKDGGRRWQGGREVDRTGSGPRRGQGEGEQQDNGRGSERAEMGHAKEIWRWSWSGRRAKSERSGRARAPWPAVVWSAVPQTSRSAMADETPQDSRLRQGAVA